MKTFVMGDIHGAFKALEQCLHLSKFDKQNDRLIVLGDVCDRNAQVRECMDLLLEITHCDYLLGNHDFWALEWALKGDCPSIWLSQGGDSTVKSYSGGPMPKSHVQFLQFARPWLVVGNNLFVHGGFDPNQPIENQELEFLIWDRSLVERLWTDSQNQSLQCVPGYEHVFVGHTPTRIFTRYSSANPPGQSAKDDIPLILGNVVLMDTGAGSDGCLTIMDVATKEFWQSQKIRTLYPQQYAASARE